MKEKVTWDGEDIDISGIADYSLGHGKNKTSGNIVIVEAKKPITEVVTSYIPHREKRDGGSKKKTVEDVGILNLDQLKKRYSKTLLLFTKFIERRLDGPHPR